MTDLVFDGVASEALSACRRNRSQAALRAALYEIENTLNPVDAVFMYQVIELVGEIADMAERVGRRLELLLSH